MVFFLIMFPENFLIFAEPLNFYLIKNWLQITLEILLLYTYYIMPGSAY